MPIAEWLRQSAANRNLLLQKYNSGARTARLREVSAVMRERKLLLSHTEACQLITAVEATAKLPGSIAEVGVYRGASAHLIREHAPSDKLLYLFDTFEGLPAANEYDDPKFAAGQFVGTSLESVRTYVGEKNVVYRKGFFPDSAAGLDSEIFAFVHLDADLYNSTTAAMDWFWPRMSRSGMILCHDYVSVVGVNKALSEFSTRTEVPILELSGYQALIVKSD